MELNFELFFMESCIEPSHSFCRLDRNSYFLKNFTSCLYLSSPVTPRAKIFYKHLELVSCEICNILEGFEFVGFSSWDIIYYLLRISLCVAIEFVLCCHSSDCSHELHALCHSYCPIFCLFLIDEFYEHFEFLLHKMRFIGLKWNIFDTHNWILLLLLSGKEYPYTWKSFFDEIFYSLDNEANNLWIIFMWDIYFPESRRIINLSAVIAHSLLLRKYNFWFLSSSVCESSCIFW